MGLTKNIPVCAIVGEYWLAGELIMEKDRVLDQLRDYDSEYINMQNLKCYHNSNTTQEIDNCESAIIPKSAIALILINSSTTESDYSKRMHYMQKKDPAQASLIVQNYHLQAKLNDSLASIHSNREVLLKLKGFFPVNDVKLLGAKHHVPSFPVALVNKSFVTFLSVGRDSKESVKPAFLK